MNQLPPLWKHQEVAIERAKGLPYFGLFNDPGTGKTRTVIEILRAKFAERRGLLRTLILCPPIVCDNWRNEWLKYSKVPPEYVTALTGTGKKRLQTLVVKGFTAEGDPGAQCKEMPKPHIFITNYESLQMPELFAALQAWKPQAIVFDEAHRLKDYRRTAKRAQAALKLTRPGSKKAPEPRPLVYCLTGTPYPNSMLDIFMIFKILDGGLAFGDTFSIFRAYYFRDKNAHMPKEKHFPLWVPLQGAENALSLKMKAASMRVKLEECMDLPPVINKTIEVEMDPEQKRIYREMQHELVAFFEREGEQKTAMADMAMVKGMRLMQIASGYVKDDQGEEHSAVKEGEWTPKQKALNEVLSDLIPGHKVIIWAVWKNNYEQIREVLRKRGIRWTEMNGEQGSAKNRANAKAFDETDDYDVILAHPESGGEGINLVSASVRISYSRNFSWRQMKQADARNYRGGSERHASVTRINLVTKGTVEGKITEKLANHEEITEAVLREITFSQKGEPHE